MAAIGFNPSVSLNLLKNPSPQYFVKIISATVISSSSDNVKSISRNWGTKRRIPFRFRCSEVLVSEPESDYETEEYKSSEGFDDEEEALGPQMPPAVLGRRRRRYRRLCPGETKGITEEMRFVAMKLRNHGKLKMKETPTDNAVENQNMNGIAWEPNMDGFLQYLVDSKLVYSTIERIVDESSDVSYVYFRNTGLERAASISMDLEWLSEQGNAIPEPSSPGITYAKYLEEVGEKNPPLFLCHFYNIYFSHIAGGQVIAKQVSKLLLEGREMWFFKWEGDAEELLRDVRVKLNAVGEHWTREEKNKCLREVTKAFRFLGLIVRLIVL